MNFIMMIMHKTWEIIYTVADATKPLQH